ncbi:MAG: preprotein translocase subunit SecG [Bryobacteraceae bacterium]|nr:preprotein translocase subunit SecG [Bryobacteraceae bacterium]
MTILLTIVHILVCVFLVIVVLLQSGKAADLAGAFGGMGSQTAFGPRGAATVLSKATTIAAALFMMTSLSLAIIATRNAGGSSSVLQRTGTQTQQKSGAAATPGAPAQQQQTPAATVPTPAPGAPQPSVDLVDETGKVVKTVPLDLKNMPQVDPKNPVIPTGEVPPADSQKKAPATKK